MSPLLEQIVAETPWLLDDLEFKVKYQSYDPKHMGDCEVILESTILRLRFLRDRSQVFCQVGSVTDKLEWHDLSSVLQMMRQEWEPAFDLGTVSARLRENFDAIACAFGPALGDTREALRLLSVARTAQLRMRK